MKKLLPILASFLLAFPALGQFVTGTVTVTNTAGTDDGDTITVNSSVRTWKDSVAVPAQEISTATSIGAAATNLFNHYVNHPQSGILNVGQDGTNAVVFRGLPGGALNISLSSGWGEIVLTTNTLTRLEILRLPLADAPYATNRTNHANWLVDGLNSFSTTAFDGLTWENGTIDGAVVTNAALYGTSGLLDGVDITNATVYATGGLLNNVTLSNTTINAENLALQGTVALALMTSDTTTSAAGSVIALEREHGAGGATESGDLLGGIWMRGYTGAANGSGLRLNSYATENTSGSAGGTRLLLSVTPTGETARFDLHEWSGFFQTNYGSLHIATNLTVGGQITEPVASSATLSGTNNVSGDVAFLRFDNSTLANGNNSAVDLNGQSFVKLSGPSGAFTIAGVAGGRNGKRVTLYNSTAQNMTVANDSGVDATAANRILTLTGGDITTTGTGAVTLIYDSAASRWIVESFRD